MDVFIERSLCQTREGLVFKGTKTDEPRKVEMPPSLLACLEAHRLRQDEFRRQFGPAYRSDLDLVFANLDGSPLMPNSVTSQFRASAGARVCPRELLCASCDTATRAFSWPTAWTSRPSPRASATPPCARQLIFTHTPSAARTTPPPCVGTISCSEPAARNPWA